jgi:hypothetical protein
MFASRYPKHQDLQSKMHATIILETTAEVYSLLVAGITKWIRPAKIVTDFSDIRHA